MFLRVSIDVDISILDTFVERGLEMVNGDFINIFAMEEKM